MFIYIFNERAEFETINQITVKNDLIENNEYFRGIHLKQLTRILNAILYLNIKYYFKNWVCKKKDKNK